MSPLPSQASAQPSSEPILTGSKLAQGIGRAIGGALIFALPLFMTMEMWELGFYIDRWRLLALLALNVPLLVFLSHYSGFERTFSPVEDFRDASIAYGVGLFTSSAVLVLMGLVTADTQLSEFIGTVALLSVPASVGALLGRSQLGAKQVGETEDMEIYGNELMVMAAGAQFLGLNVAPTEEIVLLAYKMTPWHGLALVALSLVVMHGFVFAAAFKGGSEVQPDTAWWSVFARFTLVGYAIALLVSVFVLWVFGRLDGLSVHEIVAVTIVLGFPSAIGAAAARLIL